MGVYMSGHPLQDYAKKFEEYTLTSEMLTASAPDEISDEQTGGDEYEIREETDSSYLQDGQPFVCGGIITEVTKKRSKMGRDMCYIKLEDLKGTMEIVFFSNAYAKCRQFLEEDNLITVKGKINIRDDAPPSVVGEVVFLWKDEEAKVEKTKPKERLCLRLDTKNPDIYSKVKNSIASYPGQTQVVIKCTSSNKGFVYQNTVTINNYLINELSGIIGNENIVVQ